MQRNSHHGSLTTLSNRYYKVNRLYPVLYAMHACPSYHILSISPQPFAWAVRMMYNATVHTKGCLATYYFYYYLCWVLLLPIIMLCIAAIFCLCCTLLMPLLAYAVCFLQHLYLMYIAGAIATIVRTLCCCHCLYHYCHCHHIAIVDCVFCMLPLSLFDAAIARVIHYCYYCMRYIYIYYIYM